MAKLDIALIYHYQWLQTVLIVTFLYFQIFGSFK